MSDVDNKLDFILKSNAAVQVGFDAYSRKDYDTLIPQIKQAFTAAGYVSPEDAAKLQTIVNQMVNLANDAFAIPTIQYVRPNRAMTKVQNLMSGQEWYDRFEKELDTFEILTPNPEDWDTVKSFVKLAAKKAAGLE